jgi:hypothetical protein
MLLNQFFSFVLLLFAGFLCLFGLVMLIDGIFRLAAETYKSDSPALAKSKEQEEEPTTGTRAA